VGWFKKALSIQHLALSPWKPDWGIQNKKMFFVKSFNPLELSGFDLGITSVNS
jgi:hypothetical protein